MMHQSVAHAQEEIVSLKAEVERLREEAKSWWREWLKEKKENERLRATNAELVAALKPFAGAVYNDNRNLTVTPCGINKYIKAYFVMRRLAKAGGKP